MREKRKPAVALYTRISIEADALRHKLEEKLGLTAAKLVELALQSLDRELSQQPAG